MRAPNFSMTGRAALITGAGRGIGQAMAEALASAGCAVAIQDIDLAAAESAARAIVDAGGRAVALGGDIGDASLTATLVADAAAALGGLHVLINNASIQHYHPNFTDMPAEDVERDFRADFLAPFLLSQQAVKIFRAQKWGRIVNIGSIQQRIGNAQMLAYSMCKSALENMTRGLARTLAAQGITVNLIAPGFFNTWRNRGHLPSPEVVATEGARWVPCGYVAEPQECAGLTLLLCSDAGRYITGQTIFVDGGMNVR